MLLNKENNLLMTLIKISNVEYNKCVKFSGDVDTSLYAKRNQSNESKRKKDSVIGKIGEVASHRVLKDKFKDLTEPDFNIYSTKEKSWDFDLRATGLNLHVKSQDVEQGKRYGDSWVFQKEDKHIFKEYSENDYVAFVSVDLNTKECFVRAMLPVSLLHEQNLFKPMKLAHLSNKLAIYFDDIKSLKNYLL